MRNESSADYLLAVRHVEETYHGYGPQHVALIFVIHGGLALISVV